MLHVWNIYLHMAYICGTYELNIGKYYITYMQYMGNQQMALQQSIQHLLVQTQDGNISVLLLGFQQCWWGWRGWIWCLMHIPGQKLLLFISNLYINELIILPNLVDVVFVRASIVYPERWNISRYIMQFWIKQRPCRCERNVCKWIAGCAPQTEKQGGYFCNALLYLRKIMLFLWLFLRTWILFDCVGKMVMFLEY